MYFQIYAALLACALVISNSLEANCSATNGEILEKHQESFWNRNGTVTELQHTICSIKTDEIVAKAQSTASRILTGICTLEALSRAFRSMEKTLLQRLDEVERNLTVLIKSKMMQPIAPKKNHEYNVKVSAFRTIKELLDKNLFEDFS